MRVTCLLSMPDSFEHTPALTMRMPNGALASLAGNVDPHHRVADRRSRSSCSDRVRATVERLMREHRSGRRRPLGHDVPAAAPRCELIRADSRDQAGRARSSSAATTRAWRRRPTRMPASGVDFIVRGEGDLTFRELLRALERGDAGSTAIPGCRSATAEPVPSRPGAPVSRPRRRRRSAAEPRRARARRATPSSAARSTSSRPRAAAPTTAASARSSRCAAATSTPSTSTRVLADIADARGARRARDLHRRRQHHAERRRGSRRCAARSSTPASTTSTTSCRR